jgi:lipopolysaccharide export system permease protein
MGPMLLPLHVWREWLRSLLWTLSLVLGVLVLEHMYRVLPDLLHGDAGFPQLVNYHLLLLPGFLPVALPISVLIATLFGVGKLHANGEIIAMRIGGASTSLITLYLWLSGLGFSLLLLLLNASLIPAAEGKLREISPALMASGKPGKKAATGGGHLRNVTCDNRGAGRLWLIGDLDFIGGRAERVSVHFYDESGAVVNYLSAERGAHADGHWRLYGVTERGASFGEDGTSPLPVAEVEFPALTESPEWMHLNQRRVRDLSLLKLKMVLDSTPETAGTHAAYATRYHSLFAGCWSSLVVLFCAIPFAIFGVHTSSMAGLAKAMGLLFTFHVGANICQMLGSNGHVSPILAAWLPNLLLFVIGLLLLRRVR